jgi:hypothetical protein
VLFLTSLFHARQAFSAYNAKENKFVSNNHILKIDLIR